MRSLSHQIVTGVPAVLALALLMLCATAMQVGGVSLTPNVAWVMTLVLMPLAPTRWPRGFAFGLGLLQDVLFHTPLGAQALLSLLLVQWAGWQATRQQSQRFRLRWLEAAGMLIAWHGALWLLMQLVAPAAPPLMVMLRAGVVDALWYPLVWGVATRLLGTRG